MVKEKNMELLEKVGKVELILMKKKDEASKLKEEIKGLKAELNKALHALYQAEGDPSASIESFIKEEPEEEPLVDDTLCPDCGKDVEEDAETCPHCGVGFEKEVEEVDEDDLEVVEEVEPSLMPKETVKDKKKKK